MAVPPDNTHRRQDSTEHQKIIAGELGTPEVVEIQLDEDEFTLRTAR